jgi:2-(3-amino-3-carboxypropyl)histidine synthase
MRVKTVKELEKKYDLELGKIISEIKKNKAKLVLLQFPDGLKPYATVVVDYLEKKTNTENQGFSVSKTSRKKQEVSDVEFLIWFGTCFGACDTPVGLEKIKPKIDLIVQFGHNSLQPPF